MNAVEIFKIGLVMGAFLINQSTSQAGMSPIRTNVDALPISLDPPLLTDSISSWVLHHIADRLVEEHRVGQLQGNLAKKWIISSDKMTYCFHLAEGRKFTDGEPLSADSVAKSFKRAIERRAASRVGFYLENIRKVEATSPETVCISLKRPTVNFLQILADASFSICKEGKTSKDLVYTGNYVVSGRTEKSIEIVRGRDGQAFRLEAIPFNDAFKRFNSGDLEILRNNGTGGLTEILGLHSSRVVMPDERTYFFAFNLKSSIFNELANRLALVHMIDWQKLKTALEKKQLQPSHSLLSPSLFPTGGTLFNPPVVQKHQKRVLPEFTVLTHSGYQMGEYLRAALPDIHFKQMDLAKPEFLKALKAGEFDVLFTGYGITVRDWDYLSTLFHSMSGHNMVFLKDPSVDNLLANARAAEKPEQRLELYRAVLNKSYTKIWYIPVTHSPLIFAFSKQLSIPFNQQNETINSPWLRFDGIKWK